MFYKYVNETCKDSINIMDLLILLNFNYLTLKKYVS